MPASLGFRVRTGALLALIALPLSAAEGAPEETPMLSQREYRLRLEEVIVIGRDPYWRQQQQPRWDRKTLELPAAEAGKSRLQWAPRYTRDEREDYENAPDHMNPQPRTKLFEVKF